MDQTLQSGETLGERYRQLLEAAEGIGVHSNLEELFAALGQRLWSLAGADRLAVLLYDPEQKRVRLRSLDPRGEMRAVDWVASGPLAEFLQRGEAAWMLESSEAQEVLSPFAEQLGVERLPWFGLVPLRTARRRLGALLFSRAELLHLEPSEREFMEHLAAQVAGAAEKTLSLQETEAAQRELSRERDRLRLLLEVNNAVVSNLELPDLFGAISACCREVLGHEYTSLALLEKDSGKLRLFGLDFPGGKGLIKEEMMVALEDAPAGRAVAERKPVQFDVQMLRDYGTETTSLLLAEGLQSGVCLPLLGPNSVLGTLNLASIRGDAFSQADIELLTQIAGQIAIAIENSLAYCEIEELKNKFAEEKLYLEDEIRSEYRFEEIIGDSPGLRRVLKQAETVAPTMSTVLILGETGTGKERIARAIHNLSQRRDATFVKINCASIPTGLLESELFGHEKGAFTGAISQKMGRFELAHRGTIFLDEVGDIPPELQPKLLRVLQEQEFERLGGTRTLRVDVRLIAATNRDLAKMVSDHQFRSDLYYRLNVFPILIPPLRERTDDIPILVRFFAQVYARRMNKQMETIPAETMDALVRYPWPGNVRELQNLIERAVILSPGSVLRVSLADLKPPAEGSSESVSTLEEAERRHILRALEESRWVIGGTGGAATRLGMKRTTLQSKMAKLGISRPL